MSEISDLVSKLADTILKVTVSVTDHWTHQTRSESTQVVIKDKRVHVRFLGGNVRTFKPGRPLVFYVSKLQYSPYMNPEQTDYWQKTYI